MDLSIGCERERERGRISRSLRMRIFIFSRKLFNIRKVIMIMVSSYLYFVAGKLLGDGVGSGGSVQ